MGESLIRINPPVTPSSIGAVAKGDLVLNVKDYGAKGDGTTDDTTAIQAALTAASAVGAAVELPPGGTFLTSELTVSNLTLLGRGGVLKAKAGMALNLGVLNVVGDNVRIVDVVIDGNGANQTNGVFGIHESAVSGTIANVRITNCEIYATKKDAVRIVSTPMDVRIEGNRIHDLVGTSNGIAFWISGGPGGGAGVTIADNVIRAVTSSGITVQGRSTSLRITGVTISDNTVDVAGQIPIELWNIGGLSASGNVLAAGNRGFSTSACAGVITGNSVRNQTTYGVELGAADALTISGNTFEACQTGINSTTTSATNIAITGNSFKGTVSHAVWFQTSAVGISVTANLFVDIGGQATRFNNATVADIDISGNTYIITSAATLAADAQFAGVYSPTRMTIRNNYISVYQTGSGGNTLGAIGITSSQTATNVSITGNYIVGTAGSPINNAGISMGGSATSAPGLRIERNRIVNYVTAIRTANASNDDVYITDNVIESCTNTYALKSSHLVRSFGGYEMTAAPTSGTWLRGDRVWNSTPSASGTIFWVCTTAGSPGTWTPVTAAAGYPEQTWASSTALLAYTLTVLPTGGLGYLTTSRTTGSTFDSTERAFWTFLPGGHYENLSANWTCPTGIAQTRLRVVSGGSGGGGGGAAALTSGTSTQVGGGGGGAGAEATFEITGLSAGNVGSVTVGAGGAGGTGGTASTDTSGHAGSAGSAGTASSFAINSTTYKTQYGGQGIGGGANSTSIVGGGTYGGGNAVPNNTTTGSIPGCGGAAQNVAGAGAIPNGAVIGGGAGAQATATLGGNGGNARTSIGGTVAQISTQAGTSAGGTGTTATQPGCGGGGGGAGAPGGAGGTGGAGGAGLVEIWF